MLGEKKRKLALQYLQQDVVFNVGMIEPINRGTADILYAEKDG